MSNIFSAGPEVANTALADALKDFEVKAATPSEERKSHQMRRGGGLYGRGKRTSPVATHDAMKDGVSCQNKKDQFDARPTPSFIEGYPRGNITVGKLFGDRDALLLCLHQLQNDHEKAICTFFQQEKRGAGGAVRSYLSLRVIVRPGGRIALYAVGGTRWLADRFRDAPEIFLDELLSERETPKEREGATRTLRSILTDIRVAMSEAVRQKGKKA